VPRGLCAAVPGPPRPLPARIQRRRWLTRRRRPAPPRQLGRHPRPRWCAQVTHTDL